VPAHFRNPVLFVLERGGEVEVQHRGAYCVVRGTTVIDAGGAFEDPVFCRSGTKFFQALEVVISGAADRFGLGDEDLALASASHGGEERHVFVARRLLAKGGLEAGQLRCGVHWPLHPPAALALRARGEQPGPLHNNCSGKHAGMLLAALARGAPLESYLEQTHPVQASIAAILARYTGLREGDCRRAVDGCSAPTFLLPLDAMARALALFGRPDSTIPPELARASDRIRRALTAHPDLLAGTGRFCTRLLESTEGRVLPKVGALGFHGASIPGAGAGIALHIDDGSTEAAERLLVLLLRRHGWLDATGGALAPHVDPARRNHAGVEIGRWVSVGPAASGS
jgi:L-asparaginase II